MGVESGGDDGFDLDEDSNSDDEDEVEEEIGVAESLADWFGGRTQSRAPTPTNNGDFDGGIGIVAPEELPIHLVLTLQSATQQSAEGAIINAPLFHTQQPAEGHFTNAPLYQPQFSKDANWEQVDRLVCD